MIWAGSEMGVFGDYPYGLWLYRYDENANLLDSVLVSDTIDSWRDSKAVWTGSEYGLALSGCMGTNFLRISPQGELLHVSHKNVCAEKMNLLWTGTMFFLSWDGKLNCTAEYGTILNAINSSGHWWYPSESFSIPGAINLGVAAHQSSIAWNGSHLGLVTMDITNDPDGKCPYLSQCIATAWFSWLMPNGHRIGPPILAGDQETNNNLVPAMDDTKNFTYINWAGGIGSLVKLIPDSDGDGMSDMLESEKCLSPTNFDSDGDGISDNYEDPDRDGLIGADDPHPCIPRKTGGGNSGGGGCILAPALSDGAGAEVGVMLPLLAAWALARARKRLRSKARD